MRILFLLRGGALDIPGVVQNSEAVLPILDSQEWMMPMFEIFLIENFATQTGILGVSLFFIITGYLMPLMLERYSRSGFLVNRVFRIFPVLIISLLLVGLFLYFTQNITFSISSYFHSLTLSYEYYGVIPIIGVLWTLVIEVIFYLLMFMIGKITPVKLLSIQMLILTVIIVSIKNLDNYSLMLFATYAKYISMILIGTAIYLAFEDKCDIARKILYVVSSIILSYIGFYIVQINRGDTSTYNNIGTFLLATGVFLVIFNLDISIFRSKFVKFLSNLVYPIYLIHVPVGLVSMLYMSGFIDNNYLLLLLPLGVVLGLSYLINIYVELPFIRKGRSIITRMCI